MEFTRDSLNIDAAAVSDHIGQILRQQVRGTLKRHGAVVGISGGLDSSVVAALAVRALGPERVLGLIMPDRDSSPESERLARRVAATFGFDVIKEDITAGLLGLGCYDRRDEAIRMVFPEYTTAWRCKITIPTNILEKDTFNFFQLTIEDGPGQTRSARLPVQAYLQIVAASNLKQRLRMTTLYYHAERRNWAVLGTGNKDEHQQGFFVKFGDGGADLKPIAHLFKVQVYQLAEYLDIPQEIIKRVPTTDTYSAAVTQEEFFFGLDFYHMDMLWYAMEHGVPATTAAAVLGLTEEQVEHGYANIARKIKATEPLRMPPLDVDGSQPLSYAADAGRSSQQTSRNRT